MQFLGDAVRAIVLPNLKAWIGALAGAGVSFLAQSGIDIDAEGVNTLAVGLSAVVSGLLVWLFPNES